MAADLLEDQSWIGQWTVVELDDLRTATITAWSSGKGPERITQEFSLPRLRPTMERVAAQLNDGRGLFLLRGLNVEEYDSDKLVNLYVGLAGHLGTLVPQNLEGDLIRRVTDLSEQVSDDYEARGHRGRAEMLPHSDSAEIVGLLCVRAAKRGGGTSVCSSAAVFNEIADKHAEHLDTLQHSFYFDLKGKTREGVSERRVPIFTYDDGRLACQFNKSRIEVGMKEAGAQLNHTETMALELINELAAHPNFALRFKLQPGDILFLNNKYVLHARDAYEDWPEPHRKRLLLRLWLQR